MKRTTVWLMWMLVSCSLWAENKIVQLPDGTLFLYNERATVSAPRAPMASPALARMIERGARLHALDPKLVSAVVQVESGYRTSALSSKGAIGLMQLMPDTARSMSVADPWDPEQNLDGGSEYLRRLLDEYDGDLELALAGYNAGPGAVRRYGGVPPYRETIDYVGKVLAAYRASGGTAPVARVRTEGRATRLTKDSAGNFVLVTVGSDSR